MSLTSEQQEAARFPGSIAVTAGAGTGKTHMLSERYLFHVKEEELSPLEVVAVTFTEKAAAELKVRIRSKMLEDGSLGEETLAELEAAQISTIHSLAARICRDHYESARLPADFSILDEAGGAIWLADKFDEALAQLPLDIYERIRYSFVKTAVWSLLEDPVSAEKAFNCSRDQWEKSVKEHQKQGFSALKSDQRWTEALRTCRAYQGSAGDLGEESRRMAVSALETAESANDIAVIKSCLQEIAAISLRGGSKKNWAGGGLEEVKSCLKNLKAAVEDNIQQATLTFAEIDDELFALLEPLKKAFELVKEFLFERKRDEKVLSFADLEEYALKILKDADARLYYQGRWKAFLIDEFQDTNAVQSELLSLLTQTSTLTVVGDEKQSIYGFRRADTAVFRKFRAEITGAGGKDSRLSQSFRTHEQLITTFNKIFAEVLANSYDGLSAHRLEAPHQAPHLNAQVVDPEDKKLTKTALERVEARQIAIELKEMLDSGVLIHDKKNESLRPIRPGDIAVLSRTWDALNNYADALASFDIPAVHAGGGNLLATREAKDAYCLIRFLADPLDDIALMAILRSPFFGTSDKTIFEHARRLPKGKNWWPQIEAEEPGDLAAPVEILKQLLAAKNIDTPARLLQKANRLTGYQAVVANLPQGARREADWSAFLNLVEQQSARGLDDVFGLAQYLARLIKMEVEIPRTPLEPGNAVSLMTIHAAKGLEWPVVVVPDLSRRLPNDAKGIYFEPDFGAAFKIKNEAGEEIEPAIYQILKQRQKEKESEEAKRVLYVALTRARDRVFLTSTAAKGSGMDILASGLIAAGIPVDTILFSPEHAMAPIAGEMVPFAYPEITQLTQLRFGLKDVPASGLTDYAICPERFRYKYIDGHPGLGEGTAYGRRVGKLVHKAIEKNITEIHLLRYYDYRLPKIYLEESLKLAAAWKNDSVYEEFRKNIEAHERQVRLPLGSILVSGAIDLLGGDFVLDFKTDKEVDPLAYRFQLWAYAKAAQKKKAHIAFLRHGLVHTFNEQDLAAIEQEADLVAKNISQGQFAATPAIDSCSYCQFIQVCRFGIQTAQE